MARSVIRIERGPGYRDALRAYTVKIDGARVGKVRSNQTVDFVVEPGEHRVRLTISWTGSPEVAVQAPPNATVTVIAHTGSAATALFDLLSKTRYIGLMVGPESNDPGAPIQTL